MDMPEYQYIISNLDRYNDKNAPLVVLYALGLCGESGEVADKIKKVYRDHDGRMSDENRREILKELGDTLWYLTRLTTLLRSTVGQVAKLNVEKLRDRQNRGVIGGEGDNR